MVDASNSTSFIGRLLEGFDWSKRDRRLDGFPLMSSIWPTIFITMIYAFLALVVGPRFMMKRKPYKMEIFGLVFNTFQFFAEFALIPWIGIHYFFTNDNGWGKHQMQSYLTSSLCPINDIFYQACQPIKYDENHNSSSYKVVMALYWLFLIRLIALGDGKLHTVPIYCKGRIESI